MSAVPDDTGLPESLLPPQRKTALEPKGGSRRTEVDPRVEMFPSLDVTVFTPLPGPTEPRFIPRIFESRDFSGLDLSRRDLSNCVFIDCDFIGADLQNSRLHGSTFVNCEMVGADLSGANLAGAKIIDSDCAFARFVGSNLREVECAGRTSFIRASFREASMMDIKLIGVAQRPISMLGADLSDADLTGSTIQCVDASRTNLRAAIFSGCNAEWLDISRADATGANFTLAKLTNCVMTRALLLRSKLTRSIIKDSVCDRVDFTLADLTEADGAHSSFAKSRFAQTVMARFKGNRTDMPGATFISSNLEEAQFVDADLSNACFEKCEAQRASFARSDLTGAVLAKVDLTEADLFRANFERATLRGVVLNYANVVNAFFLRARCTSVETLGLVGLTSAIRFPVHGVKSVGASLPEPVTPASVDAFDLPGGPGGGLALELSS